MYEFVKHADLSVELRIFANVDSSQAVKKLVHGYIDYFSKLPENIRLDISVDNGVSIPIEYMFCIYTGIRWKKAINSRITHLVLHFTDPSSAVCCSRLMRVIQPPIEVSVLTRPTVDSACKGSA